MPFPYIFTFYSYKGGVGRSMALMNVAYALVSKGRHVLVVDMDLEAPGVSGFLRRNQELAESEYSHPKDILTLLDAISALSPRDGEPKEQALRLPEVTHYIRSVADEKLADLQPKLGKIGRFDVAGVDIERNYHERLTALKLGELSRDRLVWVSRVLHHYFKQQRFPFRPLGIEDFEEPLSTPYDYVLVDSRTGFTEIGGLCIGPLADRLVVLAGLNDQNVEGTLDFMRHAGIEPRARSKGDKTWDAADPVAGPGGHPSLGPKPTIVVASPVPSGEIAYKKQRLDTLQKKLGIRPFALSYHPQMALMESIFVRDCREEYLASEYWRLTALVMAQVGDDAQSLFSGANLIRKENLSSAIESALRVASDLPELGIPLLESLANLANDDDALGSVRKGLCATLTAGSMSAGVAFLNWGNALVEQARQRTGNDANRLLAAAEQKYAEAVRLKPDYAEAFYNWGIALAEWAKMKTGEEADVLFEAANKKYAEAVRLKQDFADAFCNWGIALSEWAKLKTGEEADVLFEAASEKYAEAVRLKPDFAGAHSNWGAAKIHQAQQKGGDERKSLLQQALQKLLDSEKVKPLSGAFNLACVEALEGHSREAIDWLSKTPLRISKRSLTAESDFDLIRNDPEFIAFLSTLPDE